MPLKISCAEPANVPGNTFCIMLLSIPDLPGPTIPLFSNDDTRRIFVQIGEQIHQGAGNKFHLQFT
jgi:hypothetical protein